MKKFRNSIEGLKKPENFNSYGTVISKEMNKLVNKIICGDASKTLKEFPPGFIDCIVTSPPYWALRDYGTDGQLGLEKTFGEYITKLCDIFDEIKRVLKKTGTCWVNLGDTYGGSNCGYGQIKESSGFQNVAKQTYYATSKNRPLSAKIMPKSLIMIPFRFAIEMVNRGWILRNVIIWQKPNCMPSSVKDRFTVDFEYLFFFVKSKKYYFEQLFDNYALSSDVSDRQKLKASKKYNLKKSYKQNIPYHSIKTIKRRNNDKDGLCTGGYEERGRNKRAVWKIPTKPYKEAHFAVYPDELVETPIKAGCPESACMRCGKAREKLFKGKGSAAFNISVRDVKEGRIKISDRKASSKEVRDYEEKTHGGKGKGFIGYTECGCNAMFEPGIVLDPFCGSGTTLLMAKKLGRNYIGIDINPDYVKMSKKRIDGYLGVERI